LAMIEGHVAPIYGRVANEHYLPGKLSEDHVSLVAFIVSMALRTEYSADSVNETADGIFKAAFRDDPRVKGQLDHVVLRSSNAPAVALGSLEKCTIVALDLAHKLLLNKTNRRFVISDNPVIKYNQFYRPRNSPRGHLGFASTGLQLFLPIDSDTCLFLYDQSTYRVGTRRQAVLELYDPRDLDEINSLEYLNAYKHLYFGSGVTEEYIRRIETREKNKRQELRPRIIEYEAVQSSPNSQDSIIEVRQPVIKRELQLSFIRTLKKAKQRGADPGSVDLRNGDLVRFLTRDIGTPPAWLDRVPKFYRQKAQ